MAAIIPGTASHQLAGLLKVVILEGRALTTAKGGAIDPYCVIRIKHGAGGALSALLGAKVKSQVLKNNTNPLWNETHYLNVQDTSLDLLNIRIKDKNLLKDNLIGSVDIPVRDFVGGQERDLALPLVPATAGTIHLRLQLAPSGSAPGGMLSGAHQQPLMGAHQTMQPGMAHGMTGQPVTHTSQYVTPSGQVVTEQTTTQVIHQ